MLFDKEARRSIHQYTQSLGIRNPAPVFELIERGGTPFQVQELIDSLLAEVPDSVELRENPASLRIFGRDLIESEAIEDMQSLMRLPYALRGALMPDAHRTRKGETPVGAVVLSEELIPDVVGSDISCSVLLTVVDFDVDDDWFVANNQAVYSTLMEKTFFGSARNPQEEPFIANFLQRDMGLESSLGRGVFQDVKQVALYQFGTSGSGNHFVELGYVNIEPRGKDFVQSKRKLFAVLSHFGSRGVGSRINRAFGKHARSAIKMPEGVGGAYLSEKTPEGRDYFKLVNWAGHFAEQGHRWLHTQIIKSVLSSFEVSHIATSSIFSRHNFVWKTDGGYLHRKGATPAMSGEYGVIPATMVDGARVVLGLGNEESLFSASHGAGRVLSRSDAFRALQKSDTGSYVKEKFGVTLIGGGADEDPRVYKQVDEVLRQQSDCVSVVGEFRPKIVRMDVSRY